MVAPLVWEIVLEPNLALKFSSLFSNAKSVVSGYI